MCTHEVSKDDVYLAVATKNQNVIYFELNKQIYNRSNEDIESMNAGDLREILEDDKGDQESEGIQYDFVAKGFHSGPLTCMEISL